MLPKCYNRVHAAATFQPHNISHKIFSNTIKIRLLFINTTTYTSWKITSYVFKQSFVLKYQYESLHCVLKHWCKKYLITYVFTVHFTFSWCEQLLTNVDGQINYSQILIQDSSHPSTLSWIIPTVFCVLHF